MERAQRLRSPRGDGELPDLSGHQVYACGVPVMVDAAQRDFIAQCRLPEDEFFADSFTPPPTWRRDSARYSDRRKFKTSCFWLSNR